MCVCVYVYSPINIYILYIFSEFHRLSVDEKINISFANNSIQRIVKHAKRFCFTKLPTLFREGDYVTTTRG